MSVTLEDLRERLKSYDEVTLMEILNISGEDLCERFTDRIEDRYDVLSSDLEEDEELQTEGE